MANTCDIMEPPLHGGGQGFESPTAVCSEVEPQHREDTSAYTGGPLRREACLDGGGGSITVQTAIGCQRTLTLVVGVTAGLGAGEVSTPPTKSAYESQARCLHVRSQRAERDHIRIDEDLPYDQPPARLQDAAQLAQSAASRLAASILWASETCAQTRLSCSR